jgi:hypothetical protein
MISQIIYQVMKKWGKLISCKNFLEITYFRNHSGIVSSKYSDLYPKESILGFQIEVSKLVNSFNRCHDANDKKIILPFKESLESLLGAKSHRNKKTKKSNEQDTTNSHLFNDEIFMNTPDLTKIKVNLEKINFKIKPNEIKPRCKKNKKSKKRNGVRMWDKDSFFKRIKRNFIKFLTTNLKTVIGEALDCSNELLCHVTIPIMYELFNSTILDFCLKFFKNLNDRVLKMKTKNNKNLFEITLGEYYNNIYLNSSEFIHFLEKSKRNPNGYTSKLQEWCECMVDYFNEKYAKLGLGN